MGRPLLPLGTWGKITRTEIEPGLWRARAQYRDYDGRTRTVQRAVRGKTGAPAERELVAALRDRAEHSDTSSEITRDTTIEDLADAWIDKRAAENKIKPRTLDGYKDLIRVHIVPSIGGLRIHEATVGKLDRFIRAVPGDTSSRQCRVVLSGMMKLAAQHDAVKHNPVRDTTIRSADRAPIRALTIPELQHLRRRVAAWVGGNTRGPKRGQDIPDMFDVLAGTGARIGEVLAIREEDIVWPAVVTDISTGEEIHTPGLLTIAGTVVDGHGRQSTPKTDASYRQLKLPEFAVAALRRQLDRGLPAEDGLVFPGRHGGARHTHNVRIQIRDARRTVLRDANGSPDGPEELFDWVTPKVFRKTVATLLDAEEGLEQAADQLGHATTDPTRMHYVQKAAEVADYRHVLNMLAPGA